MRRRLALLLTAALLSACGGTASQEGSGDTRPEPAAPASAPSCPNPEGGSCLGALAAGTYTTQVFSPAITYTVPSGWENDEDLIGNVLLVPPGGSLAGVDAGTSDYIGVFSSTAVTDGCTDRPAVDVGHTPEDIAAHLASEVPGLAVVGPRPAHVGGLTGVVLDLTLQEGFSGGCDQGLELVTVPVIIARPPSSFAHAVVTGLTMRLYLLDRGTEALAIEVDDVHGGSRLDEYSRLVEQMTFAVTA